MEGGAQWLVVSAVQQPARVSVQLYPADWGGRGREAGAVISCVGRTRLAVFINGYANECRPHTLMAGWIAYFSSTAAAPSGKVGGASRRSAQSSSAVIVETPRWRPTRVVLARAVGRVGAGLTTTKAWAGWQQVSASTETQQQAKGSSSGSRSASSPRSAGERERRGLAAPALAAPSPMRLRHLYGTGKWSR